MSRSCSYNRRAPRPARRRAARPRPCGPGPARLAPVASPAGRPARAPRPPGAAVGCARRWAGRPEVGAGQRDLVKQRAGAGPLDGRQRLADVAELGLPLDHPLVRPGILGEQLGALVLGAGSVAALVLGQPQRLSQVVQRRVAPPGLPRQGGARKYPLKRSPGPTPARSNKVTARSTRDSASAYRPWDSYSLARLLRPVATRGWSGPAPSRGSPAPA